MGNSNSITEDENNYINNKSFIINNQNTSSVLDNLINQKTQELVELKNIMDLKEIETQKLIKTIKIVNKNTQTLNNLTTNNECKEEDLKNINLIKKAKSDLENAKLKRENLKNEINRLENLKNEQLDDELIRQKNLNYRIEYGEAAFYGPKLDFMVKDALQREWQLGTIQVDYNLPERFDLTYKNKNNDLSRPVMIHRAPFGSLERFIAILIEHTEGDFPLWLTTNQIKLIAVGERHKNYSQKVSNLLEKSDIRASCDLRNETVGKKIREAEKSKIPFMGIIGEKELNNETISIRKRGGKEIGNMNIKKLINFIREQEVKSYN